MLNLVQHQLKKLIKNYTMKKLSNLSPFILLLVPIFAMMILAFATSNPNRQNDTTAIKTTTSINSTAVKVATSILK
jgi:hypothetical protein